MPEALIWIVAIVGTVGLLVAALTVAMGPPVPTPSNRELDAYQCDSWREEGYTEEEIKRMCLLFTVDYVEPGHGY